MKLAVLSCTLGAAAAFAPASTTGNARTSTALSAYERSPAMPFLPYPENCRGYIGDDIAFDPLFLSDYFPMDYLRESEIKHGRIAMLAIVGWITTDLGIVLHPLGQGLNSVSAHDVMVSNGVMGNLFIWFALAEMVGYIGISEMLQGSGREPGEYGFGVGYYKGKTEDQIKKLKYNEIMNGRLAMLAFGGACTQEVLFGKGFPYF